MSNYDSTPRPAGRIDWTCDDCGRGVFGYSEADLTFQIDMHGEYCGDPDRGSLGETARVAPFVIDALTEGECPATAITSASPNGPRTSPARGSSVRTAMSAAHRSPRSTRTTSPVCEKCSGGGWDSRLRPIHFSP